MYVPGEMSDVDTVLVDIGTGYYVDMVSINVAFSVVVFVICFLLSLSLSPPSLSFSLSVCVGHYM